MTVHFSHNAAVIKEEQALIHPLFQGESIKERFNRGVSMDGLIIFLLALPPHALSAIRVIPTFIRLAVRYTHSHTHIYK